MAWGAKDTSTQLTSVSTQQFFDDIIQPPGNGHVHEQVISTASGTTDDLIVEVYATLDDSTPTWDDVNSPIFTRRIPNNAAAANEVSFVVSGVYRYRIGVRRSGTTDTFTVDRGYRVWTP